MSGFTFALIWCAVQVTLVSASALMAIRFVIRRRPEVAATTAAWAAGVALLATLLVPVQLPESMLVNVPTSSLSTETTLAAAVEEQAIARTHSGLADSPSNGGIHFDLALLIRQAMILKNSRPLLGESLGFYLILGLSIGVVAGLVKYALGLFLLRTLRRNAEVIHDGRLHAMAQSMVACISTGARIDGGDQESGGTPLLLYTQQLNSMPRLNFAQSSEIQCAAVVGFFRPLILLSEQWTTWTDEELRAVLAHELAHFRRRDSLSRQITTLCSTLHFYNPLVRWLGAELVLAQELAADQLALRVTGGAGPYLRSLAQLAIRQDASASVRSRNLLVPFFSGHLMRRIEMLRAMDCEQVRSPRRWLSSLLVVSIAMFGMTTTLIRCFAQSAVGEKATLRDTASAESPKNIAGEKSAPQSKTRFMREKIPASHPALDKKGGLHLNLAAFRQTPFGAVVESAFSAELFHGAATRDWDLKLIDSVTSNFNISLLKGPNKPPENHQHTVAFGFDRMLLTTNQDVDWLSVIQSRFAKSILSTSDEIKYVDLGIPDLGLVPLRLQPVSPRQLGVTIQIPGVSNDKVKDAAWDSKPEERSKPQWSEEWDAISGGLVAIVVILPEPPKIPEFNDKFETAQFKLICGSADLISMGFDFSPEGNLAELKIRLRCKETADSAQVLEAVDKLLGHSEAEATKTASDAASAMSSRISSEILHSRKMRVITGSRNIIECQMQYRLTPEVLAVLSTQPSPAAPASKNTPVGAKPESTRIQ
jgi:Zn-dependent protease with chaperone function